MKLSRVFTSAYRKLKTLRIKCCNTANPPLPNIATPTTTTNSASDNRVLILGIDISKYSRQLQFIICVSGVFVFYILSGYYQELIFRIDGFKPGSLGFKPFGWYLTFIQFIYYTIFASIESITARDVERRIPLKTYALLGFLTVGTMGMSNASLGYLNYPTQIIFKCCKLIPVMIGGFLIQGKRYGCIDLLSCVSMSLGLTFFILADTSVQPSFDTIGLLMMTLALSADAVIGNVQEHAMTSYSASNTEVVLYSYGTGVIYLFILLLPEGRLFDGFNFFLQHPMEKYGYAFMLSITGYLGISFVLSLVRTSGALLAVTVTTCRKGLTIVLSFLLFTKPFTFQYVWSGLIVLVGILLNVYRKNKVVIDVKVLDGLYSIYVMLGFRRRQRLIETI